MDGRRIVIVVVLVVALGGMSGLYKATSDARWPYPTTDELHDQPEQYDGETILIAGPVIERADSTVTVRIQYTGGTMPMRVTGVDAKVQPGGSVQVFGTFAPGDTVDAERTVVVNRAGGSKLYKYGVSLIAVGMFLLYFFRYWRVNQSTLRLEGRSDG
jgi:hypothetical protein